MTMPSTSSTVDPTPEDCDTAFSKLVSLASLAWAEDTSVTGAGEMAGAASVISSCASIVSVTAAAPSDVTAASVEAVCTVGSE